MSARQSCRSAGVETHFLQDTLEKIPPSRVFPATSRSNRQPAAWFRRARHWFFAGLHRLQRHIPAHFGPKACCCVRGGDVYNELMLASASFLYNDIVVLLCQIFNHVTVNTETRLRVNENGRVVIPAAFRKALGINVGDEVVLRIEDDELRITTLKRRLERAQRLVRKHVKPGTSLVDQLISERREASRHE
jgi:AbrB family looped-hinge helix DNA binding protein